MSDTIEAIKRAYQAAFRRLLPLDGPAFLRECFELGWSDLPDDMTLGPALLELARRGSIDAAAALNVLAFCNQDDAHEREAEAALVAMFRRNDAVRAELQEIALVALLEDAARDLGYVPIVDRRTGETRWKAP